MATKTSSLTERFHNALAYASELHAGQFRKGSRIPYVSHLLAVTAIVLEAGGTEDEAIAAVLHDAAEDQGGLATLAEIRRRFGDAAAAIVDACSDTFESPKPAWAERKRRYQEHLAKADVSTLLVSAADKLHNARSTLRDLATVGPSVFDRFSATREQTIGNYEKLLAAYESAAPDPRRVPITDELREVVRALRNGPR